MTESKIIEKSDSIKVSCNAKEQYSFEVKIYHDSKTEDSFNVIDHMEEIYKKLQETFK